LRREAAVGTIQTTAAPAELPRPLLSPELRATFFYFTQLMNNGAAVAYGGIWFIEKGIHPEQIATINSLPTFILLALNLVVGRLADRVSDWRQVIVWGSLISGVLPIGLFFVNEFWGILAVWTLSILPRAAVTPVADAATLRLTTRNRRMGFGTIRAWGTVGYLVAIGATSLIVGRFGPQSFVPLFVTLALLRAFASLFLPKFRSPARQATLDFGVAKRLRDVMKLWFVLPLFGYAMVFGTHIILDAFSAILWKQQGIPETIIGPLIMEGALAEAVMMFLWSRIQFRMSARGLLLISCLVAAFRWAAMGLAPPVPVLVLLQTLHSITFALGFLGAVHFIARWTSEDIAAEGQAVYTVLQQAMAVLAVMGFGWLVPFMGIQSYFVAGAFAFIGGLIVAASLRLKPPEAPLAAGGSG
jgi:PPP family 3-phenylpropionic acid transporter